MLVPVILLVVSAWLLCVMGVILNIGEFLSGRPRYQRVILVGFAPVTGVVILVIAFFRGFYDILLFVWTGKDLDKI